MEIYRVFRKKCIDKNHYIWLALGLLFFVIMTYRVMNDEYVAFRSLFMEPKRIEAGEDLGKYNRYEVVCDVPYVLANKVDFFVYEEDVRWKEDISYRFVGLDNNKENPFLFEVDGEGKYGIAMDMVAETTKGRKSKFDKVTVQGYVTKLSDEEAMRYINGLKAYYGESDYSDIEEVYFISPWSSFWGWQRFELECKIFLWIFSMFTLFIPAYVVCHLYANVGLKKQIQKWNADENDIDQDFVRAWEADDGLWIGDCYTYYAISDSAVLFPNSEIVWIYKETVSRKKQDLLVFYTLDKRRYSKYVDKSMTECILSYYEKQYPRILVNQYNKELLHMFKNNYNVFLDLKYRQG